jgi:hypothetical protein
MMTAETCAVCGRLLPKLAVQHGDTYYSSVCCKAAYQVPSGPGIRTSLIDEIIALTKEEAEHVGP